jgi:hypothetical protein
VLRRKAIKSGLADYLHNFYSLEESESKKKGTIRKNRG